MSGFIHRLAAAYGSAIILMFFSEYFFLNEEPVAELLATLKSTPLLAVPAFVSFASFYVLFTYPFLVALSFYNVRTISGLVLAGAIFGWATEGLTIPVIYEAIPVSFVFPSIGWHSLIDVAAGWFLVRFAMRQLGLLGNGVMFIVLGALWGAWATWYWGGSDANAMAPLVVADFGLLVVVSSGFWLAGMVLADHFGNKEFKASRWEVGIVGLIYVLLFAYIAVPHLPWSALIVPVIALTVLALWRGRNYKNGQIILERLHPARPPWWSYLLALLTPATAVPVYAWFVATNTQVPTEAIVQMLLLIGFVWFVFALVAPFVPRSNLQEQAKRQIGKPPSR
ncbi:hypothetical protein MNBD_ALPHA09-1122 [hydrothermal vent metagenome]|uniref:Uncharacterized protein n=1 Tax=hydrothermal vent metagenome TaxID=652676 RepID=A0A3B0T476_9ZZZZ